MLKIEVGIDGANQETVLSGHIVQFKNTDHSQVFQLSWHPRAILYKGFLSDEECDHLILLTRGKLKRSKVAAHELGKINVSPDRTSSGVFLDKGHDEVVRWIEDRISSWTFLPKENGEPLHILHYEAEDKYKPYYDYFKGKSSNLIEGQRLATVLIYLSNVSKGGETILPNSELKDAQLKDETWSPCAKASYAVKPVKGNALLFFNLHLNLTEDDSSLHGSCPVIEGEKWIAMKRIHTRNYYTREDLWSSGSECMDEDDNCPQWAVLGECQKNPVYMMGTPDYYGSCRKSCNAC
ncbi:probable prolyl 4-hydroxylase 6 isoform X2 [Aristolochia californica]|uniref:probable prolyl 4-hydroxylase 6 isoform X2 n=1 Tax=Aristolochia californica TaxID=171875 RepID=UPI0035D91577